MHNELTAIDIKKMKDEIAYRQEFVTPKCKEEVQRTRALGDLSENDEYRSAKRELNRNYSRIRYLKALLENSVVVNYESEADAVGLFDHVTLFYDYGDGETEERTITIVTPLRNDILNDRISKDSPLGKAIIGHKVGDSVKIVLETGYSYFVKILDLTKGIDDDSLRIN